MNYRYWDSVMFLGWLKREPDKVSYCQPVLDAAERGDVTVITSALTIAEVLWLKGNPKIEVEQGRQIEAFFRNDWIVIREVDRFLAERARDLVWSMDVKPKDAIHVATAVNQDVRIDQLDTFDEGMIELSGSVGNPPLSIGRPNLPRRLPFEAKDEDPSDTSGN